MVDELTATDSVQLVRVGRVDDRGVSSGPPRREHQLSIVEILELDVARGGAIAQTSVDPRVLLADAPETLGLKLRRHRGFGAAGLFGMVLISESAAGA